VQPDNEEDFFVFLHRRKNFGREVVTGLGRVRLFAVLPLISFGLVALFGLFLSLLLAVGSGLAFLRQRKNLKTIRP
jgi:hypothetical protein